MGLQITASKSALLLQCPRPFAPDTVISEEGQTVSEGARWGSAAHLCLDEKRVTNKFDAKSALVKYEFNKPSLKQIGDLENQVNAGWSVLQAWLEDEGLKIVSGEKPLAYRLDTGQRRLAHFEEEGHHYDLKPGEVGGTPDLLLEGRNPIRQIVLDFKTGDFDLNDFSRPEENAQLLTLALMTGADEVAVLHMPLGSIPVIYHAKVDRTRLQNHLDDLAVATNLALKSGPIPFMRAGKECKYCPARFDCPARDAELIKNTNSLAMVVLKSKLAKGDLAKVDLGKFKSLLTELSKLIVRGRDELKELVRAGEIIEVDGKTLEIVTREVERLSKKKFVEVLGPVKAEVELERLRKMGILVKEPEERLEAR